MPPSDKTQPSPEDRDHVRAWIDEVVFWVDPENPDPGPLVIRRMNRAEYNNVVRDVLHIDSRPADQFPPDDATHGFDTVGAGLTLSPLLMEKLMISAGNLAKEATRLEPVQSVSAGLRREEIQWFGPEESPPEYLDGVTILRDARHRLGVARPGVPGLYRIYVRAATNDAAILELLDGDQALGELAPQGEWKGKRQFWEPDNLVVELTEDSEIYVKLSNPSDDGSRLAAVERLGVQGPLAPGAPSRSQFLESILPPETTLAIPTLKLGGEDLVLGEGRSNLDTGKSWYSTRGYRYVPLALEKSGRYRIRVHAGAQQAGDELVKLEVRLGERSLGVTEVTAQGQSPEWVEVEADCEAGRHDLQLWFVNGAPADGDLTGWDAKVGERWLWIHEFEVSGPLETPLASPATIRSALAAAGRQIWRRPLTEEELDRVTPSEGSPEAQLRAGLEALLASPRFLFLNAQAQPVADSLVDEFTLAERMAIYLWSSAPDEELLSLAEQVQLRANLQPQLARMMADQRFDAFIQNFVGQWLQLRDLEQIDADPELLASMRTETELFFRESLDRPVSDLLDANFSFIDPILARHYGLEPGTTGFHRREMTEVGRGGFLRQASLLTLTSHPTRTSPVKRGQFVLDKILGAPPPLAPADVPPLEDADNPVATAKTLRAQLEAHRQDAKCSGCHAYFDPVGFAFENYDHLGRWREVEIDTSGALVTGETFEGAASFSTLLASEFDEALARSLTEQLLTYALGRGLDYKDKIAIQEVLDSSPDRRLGELILGVCRSTPFQKLRTTSIE